MTKESMSRRNSHKLRESANHNAQLAAYYANAAQEEAALANYYDGHACGPGQHMEYGWGFDGGPRWRVCFRQKARVKSGKGVRSTGYYDGEMSWPEFKEGFKQKVCSVGPIKSTFNTYCAGAGGQYFDIDDTDYGEAGYYGHKCADGEHMEYGWGFDGSGGECAPDKKARVKSGKGVRSTGYYDGEMSWPEFKEGFKQKVCSVGPIKSTFNNFCAGAGPQYFDIDNTKYEGHKGQLERCVTGFNGDEVCEADIRAGGICDRDESDWKMFVPAQKDMETLRQICARNVENDEDEIAV